MIEKHANDLNKLMSQHPKISIIFWSFALLNLVETDNRFHAEKYLSKTVGDGEVLLLFPATAVTLFSSFLTTDTGARFLPCSKLQYCQQKKSVNMILFKQTG